MIPLTLHTDACFQVNRTNQLGDPLDFDDSDEVCMVVDLKNNQTIIAGVLEGNTALFTISSQIADQCTNWTSWWVVQQTSDTQFPDGVNKLPDLSHEAA